MEKTTLEQKRLEQEASKLLKKNGFLPTGEKKQKLCKAQNFFEKRILMTPMGIKR